ncbi:putative ABC transporter permease [Treponema primitia]|uniref:putative ABC transporter permease n=1 Tax=Treponema primitia TaxID=88058 RepID=UPI00025557EC|nr:putative ABC transporter permease [Treponema primitia]
MFNPLTIGTDKIVFLFFFFSLSGWVGETIMESIVRKRFVSKGFFKGPWVPVHGFGGFAVYAAGLPLKPYPPLVFISGALLCTVVEYLAALLLEKAFNKKCWDYDTYPFTWWCNYKKRIALTTSLFFGLVALALVYFYWDLAMALIRFIGPRALFGVDLVFLGTFAVDAFFTIRRYIQNKKAGIQNPVDGLA